LTNLSELRILTTFYFTKTDHQWFNFIISKSSSIIGASEVIAPEISRDRARFFGQRTEGAPSYRRRDFSVYASLLLACMFFIDPIGFFSPTSSF
jgi:hypothetical protein